MQAPNSLPSGGTIFTWGDRPINVVHLEQVEPLPSEETYVAAAKALAENLDRFAPKAFLETLRRGLALAADARATRWGTPPRRTP